MKNNQRETWGSRSGLILAAVGSAIGLGNVWRFPYLAGENGGSAFIIIYLVCALVIGLSVMIAEWTLGRKVQLEAASAFKKLNKNWAFAGVLGVLTAFLILGFYPTVGGWSLAYTFKMITGLTKRPDIAGEFGLFVSSSFQPLIWMAIYLVINGIIISKGVRKGIEKASRIMMPVLFLLFVLVAIRSVTLPGAKPGLDFLLKPDFSKVTGETFLAALGQSFFSLSLGMGIMVTYGSYIPKEEKIPSSALLVTILDTGIALLAGLAIFPALFAFGLEPTQGAGLVFAVVPQIFAEMGTLGPIFGFIFFLAFTLAAITSSMSLFEVVVAYLIEEKKFQRKKAVKLLWVLLVIMNGLASLSMGLLSNFKIFGHEIFGFLDSLTDKVFLAIGGILVAVFVGWIMPKDEVKKELTNEGSIGFKLFDAWYFALRYIIPVLIGIVAITGMMGLESRGIIGLGLAIIGLLAIFSKKL